jgi:hypothetical protein
VTDRGARRSLRAIYSARLEMPRITVDHPDELAFGAVRTPHCSMLERAVRPFAVSFCPARRLLQRIGTDKATKVA